MPSGQRSSIRNALQFWYSLKWTMASWSVRGDSMNQLCGKFAGKSSKLLPLFLLNKSTIRELQGGFWTYSEKLHSKILQTPNIIISVNNVLFRDSYRSEFLE